MRYRARIVRVQAAERAVRAADEEDAVAKIRAELEKPYGLLASWETKALDVEIIGSDNVALPGAKGPVDGPLLFSVKGAAQQLGVSTSVVYDLLRQGELEHLRVGRRILVPRIALTKFIEINTQSGYYR